MQEWTFPFSEDVSPEHFFKLRGSPDSISQKRIDMAAAFQTSARSSLRRFTGAPVSPRAGSLLLSLENWRLDLRHLKQAPPGEKQESHQR